MFTATDPTHNPNSSPHHDSRDPKDFSEITPFKVPRCPLCVRAENACVVCLDKVVVKECVACSDGKPCETCIANHVPVWIHPFPRNVNFTLFNPRLQQGGNGMCKTVHLNYGKYGGKLNVRFPRARAYGSNKFYPFGSQNMTLMIYENGKWQPNPEFDETNPGMKDKIKLAFPDVSKIADPNELFVLEQMKTFVHLFEKTCCRFLLECNNNAVDKKQELFRKNSGFDDVYMKMVAIGSMSRDNEYYTMQPRVDLNAHPNSTVNRYFDSEMNPIPWEKIPVVGTFQQHMYMEPIVGFSCIWVSGSNWGISKYFNQTIVTYTSPSAPETSTSEQNNMFLPRYDPVNTLSVRADVREAAPPSKRPRQNDGDKDTYDDGAIPPNERQPDGDENTPSHAFPVS